MGSASDATLPQSRQELIRIDKLRKEYRTRSGQSVVALENVDLSLYQQEFVSVVGPSGCGKTTLLKILAGLLPRSSGEVHMQGKPIEGPQEDVGVVFQSPVLLPWRTILDNTLLPVDVLRRPRAQYLQRAEQLLETVGLGDFKSRYPKELSGGMQQRAALTRALVHDPSLLLMDEPFGALDAMTREQMNLELQRIWSLSQKTVFFITHSIPEAVFLADRVVVMSPRPGRIIDIVPVPLPRPRGLDQLTSSDLGEIVRRIRRMLGDGGDGGHTSEL